MQEKVDASGLSREHESQTSPILPADGLGMGVELDVEAVFDPDAGLDIGVEVEAGAEVELEVASDVGPDVGLELEVEVEVDAEVEVEVDGELVVELVDGSLALELCVELGSDFALWSDPEVDVVVGVVLDVKLGKELAADILVVVDMASEEVTAAESAPASFDLTYLGTFRNIVVVAASVDVADHEMEAATAAAGSVAVYGTV
ncbi:hypothetical protein LEL_06801 [Akanthomyces lecanii RCEF 1005]|uniref:Uncharacterized protein n=1 Tax=Akanthomyces lecanii RCEF 1005 TaxID=1081108 RepID=A0A168GZD7_CORDF|nr:hypothetical protein LEL_06801 [Akanthomyces lecanii RCEF 1005]